MSKFRASHLFKMSAQESRLGVISSEIIRTIDERILNANKTGFSHIEYDMPEYFDIPNLERQDIQLIIYTNILTEYAKRGFDVGITQKSKLIIKWYNILDEDQRIKMKEIMKKHLIG